MADTTTNRGWTIPVLGTDPWYTDFLAIANEIDADVESALTQTMDDIYNVGGSVTVDGDPLTLTIPDAANNNALSIINNDVTNDPNSLTFSGTVPTHTISSTTALAITSVLNFQAGAGSVSSTTALTQIGSQNLSTGDASTQIGAFSISGDAKVLLTAQTFGGGDGEIAIGNQSATTLPVDIRIDSYSEDTYITGANVEIYGSTSATLRSGTTGDVDIRSGRSVQIDYMSGGGIAGDLLEIRRVSGAIMTFDDSGNTDLVGRFTQPAPSTAHAGLTTNSSISFYLDETGDNLKVAVRYSDGTLKTGTLALI